MTDKEIRQKFKETYTEFISGDEPLSPYFDIWEGGIEIATKELQDSAKDLEWQLQEVAKDNDNYQKENKELENKLEKAKGIIRKLLEDIEIAENEYKFTSQTAIKAEQFLKE